MRPRASLRYRCRPLADLARQLLIGPPDRRAAQIRRAEALHDHIASDRNYPFDFIYYHITGFHTESEGDDATILVGEAILPDLRLLIDELSRAVPIVVDAEEPVESTDELAARLGVSSKTIQRWRPLGLRWRWVRASPGATRHIAFTREAVDTFVGRHAKRVASAASFVRIPATVRQRLVRRARRIAQVQEVSLNRVAAHLSRRTGYALETMRQLLIQHDARHPADAIFTDRNEPLTPADKRRIAREIRRGVPMRVLSARYRRAPSTLYRVARERRAAALRRLRIRFVESPQFTMPDAEEAIMRDAADPTANRPAAPFRSGKVEVGELPEQLRSLYEWPPMAHAQQRQLAIRYNYLKFKAAKIRDTLDRYDPHAADLEAIQQCIRQAIWLRHELVHANLHVVLATARRNLMGRPDRSVNRLIELLEIGNQVLFESVEVYDVNRQQTFEAFLTWNLQRVFAKHDGDSTRAKQALRRLSGEVVLRRMHETAGRSGVRLPKTTSPPA